MYSSFYHFSEEPFNITPDPRFLFLTDSHREALSAMISGVRARKGFVLITGEVGTGKTTLLYYLRKVLGPTIKSVFISRINIAPKDLLQDILTALEIPLGEGSIPAMTRQLTAYLAKTQERGENVALLIDEAQSLSKQTLEGLRMLSNIETGETKLLQIVLVGQPELDRTLDSEDLRQLKQRIWIRRKIRTITEDECLRYIDHRLKKVGSSSSAVFSPGALAMICKFSGGVIRNVNILCDNALLIGYALKKKKIDETVLREALADMEISVPREPARPGILYVPKGIPRESAAGFLLAHEPERSHAPRVLSLRVLLPLLAVLGLGAALFLGADYFSALPQPQPQKFSVSPALLPPRAPAAEAASAPADGEKPAPPETRPGVYRHKIQSPGQEQVPAGTDSQGAKPSAESKKTPEKTVRLKSGDTLFSLAQENYPRANMTLVDHILTSNPEIQNMDLIAAGRSIRIPPISEDSFFSGSREKGYRIHLGTFDKPGAAARYRAETALQGKIIEVIPRKMSPATTWYRLVAGKFDSKEEVLNTMQALRKKGLLPAFGRQGA